MPPKTAKISATTTATSITTGKTSGPTAKTSTTTKKIFTTTAKTPAMTRRTSATTGAIFIATGTASKDSIVFRKPWATARGFFRWTFYSQERQNQTQNLEMQRKQRFFGVVTVPRAFFCHLLESLLASEHPQRPLLPLLPLHFKVLGFFCGRCAEDFRL